ncbi:MAG: DUF6510 family protein [Micromonosporaceae bacterium]
MTDEFLDGNALAGPLREILAVDVTTATGRCVACGRAGAVGSLRLYTHAPGLVARCPGCDAVLLRVVRGPDRAWLDLRGVVCLELALPEPT